MPVRRMEECRYCMQKHGGGGGGGDSLAYLKANDNTKTPLMKNVNCIMSHSLFL